MTSIKLYLNSFFLFAFILFPFFLSGQLSIDDSLVVKKEKNEPIDIGYGSQPEWMLTGAVSHINGDDLSKSFSANLGYSMKASLSGLSVLGGGGEPGLQSVNFYIRGLNTFGNGKSILVLVDGIEFPVEHLDPNEIQSVVVLKDAAATAIYGSKGANGVLLITTKRGNPEALKISLNTQYGFSSPIHLPRFLNSYDYATLYNEALINDGNPAMYSSQELEAYKNGSNPYLYPDVDWYAQVLRNYVPMSKYNLNFSGGNRNVRYFVFLGLLDEEGLYKKTRDIGDYSTNSKYRKFNYRSNVDIAISNRLSAHLTFGGMVEDKSNPSNLNTTDIFRTMSLLPPNSFPVYNPDGSYGGSNLYSNPWGDLLERGMYTSNGRVFQSSFMLTEQLDMITKGLSISGQLSFNSTFNDLSSKWRNYQSYIYSVDNEGNDIYTKIGENTSLAASEGQSNQWRSTILRAFMNYNRSFGTSEVEGVMMFNSSNYTLGVGGLPFYDKGLFGRISYALDKKYIAEFSFGYNASDNFPKGHQWGFFPAVSAGWVASNEEFLKHVDILDYLKIRVSYGLTGNDNIGGSRWMFRDIWGGAGSYFFGLGNTNTTSTGITSYANPTVTWEKQNQLNIGLETSLLKHIDFQADVFYQKRRDILAKPYNVLPGFLGITYPDLNVGSSENKGFESILSYNSGQSGPFQYHVRFMLWYSRNKIIDNAEGIQLDEYLYRSGRPINQPFVLEAIGFFRDQADIDNSPVQVFAEVRPGDIKYKDQNGDGVVDNFDFYPLGYSNLPDLTTGLNAGINYRNFDLDLLFQGAANRTIYLSGAYFEAFQNNGKVSEVALGRWTEATKNEATYPRLSSENNINNYQPSSFWQRNGNYLDLRYVELGYTFPSLLVNKAGIENLRVFLNGTNLFSVDKLTAAERNSAVYYPSLRTYSIGLNLQF